MLLGTGTQKRSGFFKGTPRTIDLFPRFRRKIEHSAKYVSSSEEPKHICRQIEPPSFHDSQSKFLTLHASLEEIPLIYQGQINQPWSPSSSWQSQKKSDGRMRCANLQTSGTRTHRSWASKVEPQLRVVSDTANPAMVSL